MKSQLVAAPQPIPDPAGNQESTQPIDGDAHWPSRLHRLQHRLALKGGIHGFERVLEAVQFLRPQSRNYLTIEASQDNLDGCDKPVAVPEVVCPGVHAAEHSNREVIALWSAQHDRGAVDII